MVTGFDTRFGVAFAGLAWNFGLPSAPFGRLTEPVDTRRGAGSVL